MFADGSDPTKTVDYDHRAWFSWINAANNGLWEGSNEFTDIRNGYPFASNTISATGASNPSSRPNYFVTGDSEVFKKQWEGGSEAPTPNITIGKTATVHFPSIDLDVDSDNDNGQSLPTHSVAEDGLETDPSVGKWIGATVGDRDKDGIPDIDDLSGIQNVSEDFVGPLYHSC